MSDLDSQIQQTGYSVNISWTAPFTLDVAGTDIDIVYCLNVASVGSTEPAYNVCDINTTHHLVTLDEEFSPCDSLNVTVTPFNGYYKNISGTQNSFIVHLYDG